MPFTLAHPAVVPPLRRLGLPVAAMVAGSMAPDLPLFLPGPGGYGATHSLAGLLTVDLAVGLAAVAVWVLLLRDALVDSAPSWVRRRLPARARYSRRQWVLAPLGVIVGAATHVIWDGFTHPGRWGVRQVEWLGDQHGLFQGHEWAQYVSGATGLLVVAVWAYVAVRRSSPGDPLPGAPRLGPAAILAVVLGSAAVTATAALARLPQGLHAMAYSGAVAGVVAMVVGALALAAVWHLRAAASSHGPM